MNKEHDSMIKKNRSPKGGVIIFPPFIPGGPGPIYPPFIPKPKPEFPPLYPEYDDEKETLKVKIKSVFEDEFVVIGYYDYLYATGEKVNKNGIFKIIILDENKAKIKIQGGDFVRVDERDFLVADTNKKGATKFRIYKINKKEYVLKAPNGYYVRVREKDKRLVARAEKAGPRTIFKFKTVE
ncbi:hypothetical protein [Romboutsia sp.]|uniref:fascin domain-containing protein n=1 Tax=Romboutsia sp. TaxID=1965302 RepID=UPI002CCC1334|nr:hypothetical protein [Romboutsia sp.]HSQ88876.1 hypothetical protein [Romboutsia sp.]